MKAYVYHKDKGLVLEEKEKPVLGPGRGAIVRVSACAICGTDVRTYRFGSKKIGEGRTIGHEFTGWITELSPAYEGSFAVGDYITAAPAIGCGCCPSCLEGAGNMCDHLNTIGFQYDGGFAEYMAIPEEAFAGDNVYRLPEENEVYVLNEPLACVINAQSYLKIKPGESVLIMGAGVIGCMHGELAVNAGAGCVMIAETAQTRIEQAERLLPQAHFIHSPTLNLDEEVKKLTGGKGADVVVVACSVGQAQADAMKLLAKRGRISLFGGLPGESSGFLDSNLIHYRELSVYGVHASTAAQNREAMELIRRGVIHGEKYMTGRYPLEEIEEAFCMAARGETMKVVLDGERKGSR